MSLVMAIANKNGIVVSGDRRAMRYWLVPETKEPIFVGAYDTYQKIYRTKSNHCIGVCGCGTLNNGKNTGDCIKQVTNIFDDNFTVTQEAYVIVKSFAQFLDSSTEFMICGYENSQPKIIACKKDGSLVQSNAGLVTIGADSRVKEVVTVSNENIQNFSIRQSVAFLRKINKAVFGLMKKSIEKPVISRECDILVLKPDESQWMLPPSRQKLVTM